MSSPNWPIVGSVALREIPESSVFWNIPTGRVVSDAREPEREYEVQQTFFGAFVLADKAEGGRRFAVLADDVIRAVLSDTREEE